MSELIPFSSIPEKWDWDEENDGPFPYTDENVEAAEFLSKMDWEGGMDGLLGYGGADIFPEAIRHYAEAYEAAHDALRTAINEWAAARGVVY